MATVSLAALCWMSATVSRGGGLRLPDFGVRNSGLGEASTADPADASSVHYNPAGMVALQGSDFEAGAFWMEAQTEHERGSVKESMNTGALVPHLYAVTTLGFDRWRFGIGAENAFGTSVNWGDESPLRFLVTKAQLSVLNVAPSAAFSISESVGVGVSLNVYNGQTRLQRHILIDPQSDTEGRLSFDGDSQALGFTLGLRWRPSPHHVFGVAYRSPFSLTLGGQATLDLPTETTESPMTTKLNFPQMVSAGYALHPAPGWTLASDFEWINWDVAKEARFESPNAALDGQEVPLHWHDSVSLHGGFERIWASGWSVRGGYAYWQNSIPAKTFTPLVPDSDYHSFSAGAGYTWRNLSVHLAYQFNLWTARHVTGSIYGTTVDGSWDAHTHVFIAGVQAGF